MLRLSLLLTLFASRQALAIEDNVLYQATLPLAQLARSAMLGSIRASWEQGVVASALLEFDYPSLSLFGDHPFEMDTSSPANALLPQSVLQLASSAVVRQSADGRLSQLLGDGNDAAALDGAAAGPAVLVAQRVRQVVQPSRISYWRSAAIAQLNYILNTAPRTSSGAISHRADAREYWSDGVFMGPPFISQYGAVVGQQDLLQIAFDQCRLYRQALLQQGPTGPLWAHIYSDDAKMFFDGGLWATGNAWAALGMLHVAAAIEKSTFSNSMQDQKSQLLMWIREVLDGTFSAISNFGLVPNYISDAQSTFGDASASGGLAAVAYRVATLWPDVFTSNYTDIAASIRENIIDRIDPELGIVRPVVNPVVWDTTGPFSTEAQAFFVMMISAWRDWIAAHA